jgi:hypothetical protein
LLRIWEPVVEEGTPACRFPHRWVNVLGTEINLREKMRNRKEYLGHRPRVLQPLGDKIAVIRASRPARFARSFTPWAQR